MQRITAALAGLFALAVFAAPAQALSITPGTLTLVANGNVYSDTGHSAASLIDTAANTAVATLLFENPGSVFRNDNKFGIYAFTVGAGGVVTVGDMLEVFEGGDNAPTSTVLTFNLLAGTVTGGGTTKNIGATFGFYLSTPQDGGQTYYSHTSLNADSFDHFLLYDVAPGDGELLGADIVLAMEDLFGGGDQNFSDMVVGVSDVTPVPEPGTMALIGSGLVGLYGARKRRAARRG